MDEAAQTQRKKKERSPSYPGIDLEVAIDRAEAIRVREGRNWAHVNAVLEHWSYSPKSGAGMVTVAALKKFGLLEEQGAGDDREVRLTDLARAILLDNREDSLDRLTAIREAALMPPIHAEIWKECGGALPSDANLNYQLRSERGFTDSAAQTFIRQFKGTLAFAGLLGSDSMSDVQSDKTRPKDTGEAPPARDFFDAMLGTKKPQPKEPERPVTVTRAIQLPLSLDEWATLEAAFPLTEDKWTQMLAVLHAMKPALVAPEAPKQEPPRQRPTDNGVVAFTREPEPSLTIEAQELLEKADSGGVPMYMTENLARIARENGLSVSSETAPNQIIDELRQKA